MSMGGGTLSPVVGGSVMTNGASVGVRVKAGTKLGFGVSNVLKACWAASAVTVPSTAACTSLAPVAVSEGTGEDAKVAVGAAFPPQAAKIINRRSTLSFRKRRIIARPVVSCGSQL